MTDEEFLRAALDAQRRATDNLCRELAKARALLTVRNNVADSALFLLTTCCRYGNIVGKPQE